MATTSYFHFAMYTRYIPLSVIKTAVNRYLENEKNKLDKYLNEKYEKASNVIIESLPSITGLPLSAFLNRMLGVAPMVQPANMSIGNILDEICEKLSIQDMEASETIRKTTYYEKISALRTLCQISANSDNHQAFEEWLSMHRGLMNECIANTLCTEHHDLIQEACYAVAYLARVYRFKMYDKIEVVIATLVRALAVLILPWENYIEQYREAKERHNDLELARGRSILFHYPQMQLSFSEAKHRVIGCIYYTLGDLIFSLPSPKLICFFECRIFRRREMTRTVLFTILHVVVLNLSELRSEAVRLSSEERPIRITEPSGGPLTSKKYQIYNEAMWNELPANLYSDIIRAYNDRNRTNKVMITEIMAMLRAQAPEKLPLFEEATLKALELYTGGSAGRVGETYQIGRTTGRENDVSGTSSARCRRSNLPHDTGGLTTKATANSQITTDKARKSGYSSNEPSLIEVHKKSDDVSAASSDFSTSSNTYSTIFTRNDGHLQRKSFIPPKLPNLIPPKIPSRKKD
ncbi:unnamed protein product [Trichobilharzia szidati]|nr:unnamed protein product [Trichobilharzia szidati]